MSPTQQFCSWFFFFLLTWTTPFAQQKQWSCGIKKEKAFKNQLKKKHSPSLVPEIIQFTKLKNPLKETSLGCRLFFHPILPEKTRLRVYWHAGGRIFDKFLVLWKHCWKFMWKWCVSQLFREQSNCIATFAGLWNWIFSKSCQRH